MEYVIVYTNDRMVQGHHVYYLVGRVNIFLQGNVQRITPTSHMQVSSDESITQYFRIFGHECHSCEELLE